MVIRGFGLADHLASLLYVDTCDGLVRHFP